MNDFFLLYLYESYNGHHNCNLLVCIFPSFIVFNQSLRLCLELEKYYRKKIERKSGRRENLEENKKIGLNLIN